MNRAPRNHCQSCGKPVVVSGNQRYLELYHSLQSAPHGQMHGGCFAGFVHQVCPEDEPPSNKKLLVR